MGVSRSRALLLLTAVATFVALNAFAQRAKTAQLRMEELLVE